MENSIQKFKLLTGVFLVVIFMLVCMPLFLVAKAFGWFFNKIRERQFNKYLNQLEGKNFFCYNNKSQSLEFIIDHLIPNLPASVEVIFLDGKTPKSDYERKFISRALCQFKKYQGFPHLLKIRNGNIIDESINNELFNIINQNKPIDDLMLKISRFFEGPVKNEV